MTTSIEPNARLRGLSASPVLLRASAVVFAVAYFIAMFVPTLPEGAYSDARVLSLLEDGGEQGRIILGGYALVVAGCSLIVFAAAIRTRLGTEGSPWHGAIQATAAVYAGVLAVAAALFSSFPFGVALGELEAGSDPAIYRVLSNAGFHVLLVGGLSVASLLVAAVSVSARQAADIPRWVPMLGFVVAPLLWLGVAWMPQFLFPLWVVTVGVSLSRRLAT